MPGSLYRGTAKIYQFPVRARAPASARHDDPKPVSELRPPRIAVAAFDNWYHEAAVQDADQAGKR